MKPVVTVETNDCSVFETKCNEFIAQGYILDSSSCGFVPSEKYDFCGSWQAVLVLPVSENVEAVKTSHNSDYAAALKIVPFIIEWLDGMGIGDKATCSDVTMLAERLNAEIPHCA